MDLKESLILLFNRVEYTCVDQRRHHYHWDDGVEGQSDCHLHDGGPEPPFVFLLAEYPLVPVDVGRCVVGVLDDVEELVGVVAATPELDRGYGLDEGQDHEVDDQKDRASEEGVPQGEERVEGVGGWDRLISSVLPPWDKNVIITLYQTLGLIDNLGRKMSDVCLGLG